MSQDVLETLVGVFAIIGFVLTLLFIVDFCVKTWFSMRELTKRWHERKRLAKMQEELGEAIEKEMIAQEAALAKKTTKKTSKKK